MRKRCQETWPGRPEVPYGQPFVFYELQGKAKQYDISEVKTRRAWRDFFKDKLSLRLNPSKISFENYAQAVHKVIMREHALDQTSPTIGQFDTIKVHVVTKDM